MKLVKIASSVMMTALAGQAMAACPTPQTGQFLLDDAQISLVVTGKYACAAQSVDRRWNELHSGGRVIDYKAGPTDPVDPSEDVGSYAIAPGTPATITYNYGTGGSYTYCVIGLNGNTGDGTYGFYNVSSSDAFRVRISSSSAPCF
jgi:hypothetical protein